MFYFFINKGKKYFWQFLQKFSNCFARRDPEVGANNFE